MPFVVVSEPIKEDEQLSEEQIKLQELQIQEILTAVLGDNWALRYQIKAKYWKQRKKIGIFNTVFNGGFSPASAWVTQNIIKPWYEGGNNKIKEIINKGYLKQLPPEPKKNNNFSFDPYRPELNLNNFSSGEEILRQIKLREKAIQTTQEEIKQLKEELKKYINKPSQEGILNIPEEEEEISPEEKEIIFKKIYEEEEEEAILNTVNNKEEEIILNNDSQDIKEEAILNTVNNKEEEKEIIFKDLINIFESQGIKEGIFYDLKTRKPEEEAILNTVNNKEEEIILNNDSQDIKEEAILNTVNNKEEEIILNNDSQDIKEEAILNTVNNKEEEIILNNDSQDIKEEAIKEIEEILNNLPSDSWKQYTIFSSRQNEKKFKINLTSEEKRIFNIDEERDNELKISYHIKNWTTKYKDLPTFNNLSRYSKFYYLKKYQYNLKEEILIQDKERGAPHFKEDIILNEVKEQEAILNTVNNKEEEIKIKNQAILTEIKKRGRGRPRKEAILNTVNNKEIILNNRTEFKEAIKKVNLKYNIKKRGRPRKEAILNTVNNK